ncbi:MAG TPA: hypothetical protein VGO67_04100 [Verrucomicrobiae bacterium]
MNTQTKPRHHAPYAVWLALAVLAGTVTFILAFQTSHPRLPVYQGRNLYEWIALLDKAADLHPADFEAAAAAQSAIRAIGTNAIPFAMANLDTRVTGIDLLLGWLAKHARFVNVQRRDVSERWKLGAQILDILGPINEPYLPQLIARATNNPGYSEEAMLAVGEAALPAFTNLVRKTQFPETGILIRTFTRTYFFSGLKPGSAAVVLPCLTDMAQSKDPDAARAASEAINAFRH